MTAAASYAGSRMSRVFPSPVSGTSALREPTADRTLLPCRTATDWNAYGVGLATNGSCHAAEAALLRARQLDANHAAAQHNLRTLAAHRTAPRAPLRIRRRGERPTRIAIVSLLFNWPSTGGGTVHTYETARFLARAGYDVRHIFARFSGVVEGSDYAWNVGDCSGACPAPSIALDFAPEDWHAAAIRERFRAAVTACAPDYVLVTCSWSTKVLLAEAMEEFPYVLRIAALEGLCPLNNVRLLIDETGHPRQCPENQLSDPARCRRCVVSHVKLSGALHHAERQLAGFWEPDYALRLRRVFRNAHAVFAVNPEIADLVAPHTPHVRVVPSGFDAERFPPPTPVTRPANAPRQILFAGLVDEFMKGYPVLAAAGRMLWERRRDFEIVVTSDPPGHREEFVRAIGWQSQADLPAVIRAADVLAFPTVAQEALGRSAVEAMGCGRPVVASRIGGLAWVIDDEQTGLLCQPGDPADLARQLERLLDDEALRRRLGNAGREKFEREFTWDVILPREYYPVFGSPVVTEQTEESACAASP